MVRRVALDREVARHCRLGADRGRLCAPRLEFVRSQGLLSRFVPAPPAIVVDVEHGVGARRIVVM
jgi:hypothetical protein